MEDQLVQLLANTQLSEQGPRQQAEIELKRARSNPAFPLSLANIASHTSIDTSIRQSALSNLRIFIEKNWSDDEADDEPALPIADDVRVQLKQVLLDLCLSPEGDRKVKLAARFVPLPGSLYTLRVLTRLLQLRRRQDCRARLPRTVAQPPSHYPRCYPHGYRCPAPRCIESPE